MKSTGVIRRIDDLGRIVIPKEIRKNLRIKEGDNLEVFIDSEDIILKKYSMMNIINDLSQELTDAIYTFTHHNVFITDTMEILNKITGNEIWKAIILDTIANLSKGEKISTAFEKHWAVPIPAYEMIVTGETTGQLGAMMEKVAAHFQMLHKSLIGQMKSLVEPILICFLAVVVGVILISIIQPMFSIYSQVK